MQIERGQKPYDKAVERPEDKGRRVVFLEAGDSITIGESEHKIERVSLAKELGKQFGLDIADNVPIYWLSNSGGRAKGAYIPSENTILFFDNTDEETQHHELTHAVEYHQIATPELLALYNRVRTTITEDSFEDGCASFNFMKNIHEFIADGRTKTVFIQALKNEGLFADFTKVTTYLFEPKTEA
jgi:hypothetical protein